MDVSKKEVLGDSKPSDISPSLECSDIEIGTVHETTKNGDSALEFLRNAHNVGALTPEGERRLLRKIDWMIMPLMWCCYCLQYLDKTLGTSLLYFTNIRLMYPFCFVLLTPHCSQLRSGNGLVRRRKYNNKPILEPSPILLCLVSCCRVPSWLRYATSAHRKVPWRRSDSMGSSYGNDMRV